MDREQLKQKFLMPLADPHLKSAAPNVRPQRIQAAADNHRVVQTRHFDLEISLGLVAVPSASGNILLYIGYLHIAPVMRY